MNIFSEIFGSRVKDITNNLPSQTSRNRYEEENPTVYQVSGHVLHVFISEKSNNFKLYGPDFQ